MNTELYEMDFYYWCRKQAELLRETQPEWLDWANVAEELESMGRSDKRALSSQLQRLLMHLLKWQFATHKRGERSWSKTIRHAREQIADLLEESPSLYRELDALLLKAYARAKDEAAFQLGCDLGRMPEVCPWEIATILREDWYEPRSEF